VKLRITQAQRRPGEDRARSASESTLFRTHRNGHSLAVYDFVGFVKAIFTALGRKNCVESRRCGEGGVKGAFFAFISTLDTGLPTSTIGLGVECQVLSEIRPLIGKTSCAAKRPKPALCIQSLSMATLLVPPAMYSAR
jgi:hypothetical protein